VLTVWLPKATPGEHFEGLGMLTELLRKPTTKAQAQAARGPLIEVLSSTDAGGGSAADGDGDGDDPLLGGPDTDDEIDCLAEQSLPRLSVSAAVGYGFNSAYSGVFVGLEGEELLQLPEPETAPAESRRPARLAAEADAFDVDHYIADLMLDDLARAALDYTPWWAEPQAERLREEEAPPRRGAEPEPRPAAASSKDVAAEERPPQLGPWDRPARPAGSEEGGEAMAVDSAAAAGGAAGAAGEGFGLGGEYQEALLKLPRKEFLLSQAERKRALCGLLDLVLACCYDVRTTEGEPTVESGWTLRTLSTQLSWLDPPSSVGAAAMGFVRRSLCFPLVRHLGLALTVVADAVRLLRLGRLAVLRLLLDGRATLQRGGEYGYLHNKIWLDDYCVWVQQLSPSWLSRLADKLEAAPPQRDAVGWPLDAYEALAREQGEEVEEASSSSDEDDTSDDEDGDEGGGEGADGEPLIVERGEGTLV